MKKDKRCFIKREILNDKNEKIFRGYFNKNLGFSLNLNHWVQQKNEAKMFSDRRIANDVINKYHLQNCEVEYE